MVSGGGAIDGVTAGVVGGGDEVLALGGTVDSNAGKGWPNGAAPAEHPARAKAAANIGMDRSLLPMSFTFSGVIFWGMGFVSKQSGGCPRRYDRLSGFVGPEAPNDCRRLHRPSAQSAGRKALLTLGPSQLRQQRR